MSWWYQIIKRKEKDPSTNKNEDVRKKMNIRIKRRCHCMWNVQDKEFNLNPCPVCGFCSGRGEMDTTFVDVNSYEVFESFEKEKGGK